MATAPSDFSRMLVSPPSLLPGDGIVVEAAAEAVQILLVLSDETQQFFGDLAIARAPHQQCSAPKISVVSASTAVAPISRQHVRADAQRRIGGDAGEGIGAAAVQSQDDLRSRHFDALFGGGLFHQRLRSRAARLRQRPRVPPLILQRHADQAAGCAAHSARGNDRSGSLRSPGPRITAAETFGCASTPASVRRSCSVSGPMAWPQPSPCGKATTPSTFGRQRLAVEALRDQLRRMRGAVAGRHHGDVVARAHAAVLARVAEKCRHLLAAASGSGIVAGREFVVASPALRTPGCACGCAAPGSMACLARPMAWP